MSTVRHRPEALEQLEAQTRFSRKELQILYRGFKNVSSATRALLLCFHPHASENVTLLCSGFLYDSPSLIGLKLIHFFHLSCSFTQFAVFFPPG